MDENKRSDGVADVSKGSEATEQNIIKKVCKELGLTYKQLGEAIGFNGDTLNNMASKPNDKLSTQLVRAIELYKETLNLKEQLEKLESLKIILKDLVR